jgi:hypothetical protein
VAPADDPAPQPTRNVGRKDSASADRHRRCDDCGTMRLGV